jgi:hypothetical protein
MGFVTHIVQLQFRKDVDAATVKDVAIMNRERVPSLSCLY